MERILINELQKWKEKSDRKPLILRGARQVGKTWLLKDFGKKSFKDVCYINFEQKDVLGAIFEGTLTLTDFTLHFSLTFTKLLYCKFIPLLNNFTMQEKCY